MVDWNDNFVKTLIYFIYGTSFIIMFIAITLWKDRVGHIELMNGFEYLAAFGLLHGFAEYSDVPIFIGIQPTWIFQWIKLVLATCSFAALLSFGLNVFSSGIEERRWIRGIPIGALLMFFLLLYFTGLSFTNIGDGIHYKSADQAQVYIFGFLGALVSTYAFIDLSRKVKSIVGEKTSKKFIFAAFAFGLYTIFEGVIMTPLFGVPIVVFRTIAAILITQSVLGIFQMFEVKSDV
jgi:hypothetical protein